MRLNFGRQVIGVLEEEAGPTDDPLISYFAQDSKPICHIGGGSAAPSSCAHLRALKLLNQCRECSTGSKASQQRALCPQGGGRRLPAQGTGSLGATAVGRHGFHALVASSGFEGGRLVERFSRGRSVHFQVNRDTQSV